MPHLIMEYSANLADANNISQLCSEVADCMRGQFADGKQVFPTGGIRVRAYRCDQYCVADGALDAAFLHANLKIGRGRTPETIKAAKAAIFEVIKKHFADVFQRRGLALSLEASEFGGEGTLKHNNLHALLKQRDGAAHA